MTIFQSLKGTDAAAVPVLLRRMVVHWRPSRRKTFLYVFDSSCR